MTDKNKIHITLVLDRSGSMGWDGKDEATISGFNEFLEDQKDIKNKVVLFTLVQFDSESGLAPYQREQTPAYHVVYNSIPIQDVPPLTKETFKPRGGTALNDAVGRTIDNLGKQLAAMPEDERPGHVLFVVLSDGMENASKVYTREQVVGMINHQRDVYNWDFLFLAQGMDAQEEGIEFVGAEYTLAHADSAEGVRSSYSTLTSTVRQYTGDSTECS